MYDNIGWIIYGSKNFRNNFYNNFIIEFKVIDKKMNNFMNLRVKNLGLVEAYKAELKTNNELNSLTRTILQIKERRMTLPIIGYFEVFVKELNEILSSGDLYEKDKLYDEMVLHLKEYYEREEIKEDLRDEIKWGIKRYREEKIEDVLREQLINEIKMEEEMKYQGSDVIYRNMILIFKIFLDIKDKGNISLNQNEKFKFNMIKERVKFNIVKIWLMRSQFFFKNWFKFCINSWKNVLTVEGYYLLKVYMEEFFILSFLLKIKNRVFRVVSIKINNFMSIIENISILYRLSQLYLMRFKSEKTILKISFNRWKIKYVFEDYKIWIFIMLSGYIITELIFSMMGLILVAREEWRMWVEVYLEYEISYDLMYLSGYEYIYEFVEFIKWYIKQFIQVDIDNYIKYYQSFQEYFSYFLYHFSKEF
jgi:hypothetical protein